MLLRAGTMCWVAALRPASKGTRYQQAAHTQKRDRKAHWEVSPGQTIHGGSGGLTQTHETAEGGARNFRLALPSWEMVDPEEAQCRSDIEDIQSSAAAAMELESG